ncbi:hypothetical protein BKA66DRAFT_454503 [Pyrenochaeta sp. MPI-SDFR-AT-0127]|nr:hypothetical protein BKA66DRAFT_454503 [Pyrenochaeta sp. MPI-SDFR-AT-0127]
MHRDEDPQILSLEEFCEVRAVNLSGLHIYHLPSVKYALGLGRDAGLLDRASEGKELRDHLTKEFHIPRFFWEKAGWDANGFFWDNIDVIEKTGVTKSTDLKGESERGKIESHCSSSLFLLKEIYHKNAGKYSWRYLTFSTLWFRQNSDDKMSETMILLCFDTRDYEKRPPQPGGSPDPTFQECARSSDAKSWNQEGVARCPHRIYLSLLETILQLYNDAIWSFRTPVRRIEKNEDFAQTADQQAHQLLNRHLDGGDDLDGTHYEDKTLKNIRIDREKRVKSYKLMHELLRHIIHASETLSAAIRTMVDMKRTAELCSAACCSVDGEAQAQKSYSTVTRSMNFYASFLENIKARSDAFRIRLENEIKLAFNVVDALDSYVSGQMMNNTQKLLEDTKNDGRELTQFVSKLSIIFLPPTFTAGFFGMNFFEFKNWRLVWIWFVITVPLVMAASALQKKKATKDFLLAIFRSLFWPFRWLFLYVWDLNKRK